MDDHVLVPLDGSPLAECVLPHTVAISRALDARVTLLRAMEHSTPEAESGVCNPLEWHMLMMGAEAYLGQVASRLQQAGLQTNKLLVVGEPAERIIEFARDEAVDLIVMSSHGRSGLSGWNISSVVQKVALRAYTAMMIVRAYRPAANDLTGLRYRRLLVALNGSQRAECVLPLARQLADFHHCRLLLAHVVSKPEIPRRMPLTEEEVELRDKLIDINRKKGTQYLEKLRSRLHLDVQTRLLISEHPAEALHKLIEDEEVDVVMLSAHGYSSTAQWPYGNTTLNLIAYGTTPLLIMQDLPREQGEMTQAEKAAIESMGHWPTPYSLHNDVCARFEC
jgi:nucleotide-binding universal stress UspA family protein